MGHTAANSISIRLAFFIVCGLLSGWPQRLAAQEPTAAPLAVQASSDQPPSAQPPSAQPPSAQSAAEAAAEQSASAAPEPTSAKPAAARIQFEPHIREILTKHCVECHGEKQAKGDMRVDDRNTLLSYVTAGDLANSSLWTDYLTTEDEEMRMPPLKHGNPLDALKLAAIRVWIEDGAQWPEDFTWPAAGATAMAVPLKSTPTTEKNLVQKGMTFIGFFHPAIVHFPIGLLLVSSLFVALGYLKRETFEPAAFHCLWIGSLAAIVSCLAGWSFAELRGYSWSDDAVMRHRICGIAVAVLSLGLTPIALAARTRAAPRLRFIWLGGAIALAMLVGIAGHQGGELTYGEDLFDRAYQQAFGK